MSLSTQMQTRVNKIESLIEKGYTLKTEHYDLIPNLTSPNGKKVNINRGMHGDNPLPNFSWIAFFFPFAVAAQIRHWSYFWYAGIVGFIIEAFSLAINSDSVSYAGIVISIFYAYWFPYHRWFFTKNNKEELGIIESILVGFGLSFVAAIPSAILIFSSP